MSVFRYAITVLIFGTFDPFAVAQEDRPELVFDSEVSWTDVFDAGFRPRHVLGLETTKAESINEGFDFRFASDPVLFKIGRGRTLFGVLERGEVRILKHDEAERISVQDALDRLREFARIGEGYIFKNPLKELDLEVPDADLVRQLEKANVIVRKGECSIQFGFSQIAFRRQAAPRCVFPFFEKYTEYCGAHSGSSDPATCRL